MVWTCDACAEELEKCHCCGASFNLDEDDTIICSDFGHYCDEDCFYDDCGAEEASVTGKEE